jgi:hypothetical protein
MGFMGALAAVGNVAKTVAEAKVNKKLGTHFGEGTSKPAPASTSMSNTASAPGMSNRRSSSRSGAESEYPGVSVSGSNVIGG